MFCFRASYDPNFDPNKVPDWLCIEENWQGYRISTLPWIADVARVLDLLPIENTLEDWVMYLESLGLREIQPVCCEDWFEDRLCC
jgi:hypothetical protein